MLDPDAVDLDELCTALDDRTPESGWFIHAGDGRIVPGEPDDDDQWRQIEAEGAGTGYRDMAEFVAGVHHRRAAELLDRARSAGIPSAASASSPAPPCRRLS